MDHDDAPTFKLEIGESCIIKPSYLEQLKNVDRYKVMYTRTTVDIYVWLDNKGGQGTVVNFSGITNDAGQYIDVFHDTDFSTEHWEKLNT